MTKKKRSATCVLVLSLDLIDNYPVLHAEVLPIRSKLRPIVNCLLHLIKKDKFAMPSQDKVRFAMEMLDPADVLEIRDELIEGSLKEYLFHLVFEIRSIRRENVDIIIFGNSLAESKMNAVVELTDKVPNHVNVLFGI